LSVVVRWVKLRSSSSSFRQVGPCLAPNRQEARPDPQLQLRPDPQLQLRPDPQLQLPDPQLQLPDPQLQLLTPSFDPQPPASLMTTNMFQERFNNVLPTDINLEKSKIRIPT
jgi:hypothetical protein